MFYFVQVETVLSILYFSYFLDYLFMATSDMVSSAPHLLKSTLLSTVMSPWVGAGHSNQQNTAEVIVKSCHFWDGYKVTCHVDMLSLSGSLGILSPASHSFLPTRPDAMLWAALQRGTCEMNLGKASDQQLMKIWGFNPIAHKKVNSTNRLECVLGSELSNQSGRASEVENSV